MLVFSSLGEIEMMSAANVGEHMESGYIRLRGCHLSSIIWRGNLLHDSKSCPNAYENSFDVSRLDFFLSHAWAANGTWKRLGIVMTFYLSFPFKLLIASSHVLVGFIYLAMHSAKLPTIAAILAGFFTFLVALLISLLTQNRGVTVFLDKCCITQSDPIAKLQGISRLSDYLRVSDKLVVFWSPDYLKRLWCVYELAKFLETHKMKDVIIINLDHVKFCVYMMFGELGRIVILECLVLYNHQIDIATRMPTILVWYFVSLFVAGRSAYYMDTTLSFRQMVRTFKTSNAKCSDAADEPLLHDLIKDAYGSIESFEVVVRNLCLGDDELGHNPTWLFSKATLRMLSVPFIPYIIEGALLSAFYGLDGTSMPMCVIGSPAPVMSKPFFALYSSQASIVSRILLCCQTPVLLLVAHKLTVLGHYKNVSQALIKVSIISFSFMYIWMKQVVCGRYLFELTVEARLLWDSPTIFYFGMIYVIALIIVLRQAYSYGT